MKKLILSLALILLFSPSIFSQDNHEKFWDYLLENQREKASQILKKNKSVNSIEDLIIYEISRIENGQLKNNDSFLDDFLSDSDFEYYLYALWNEPYIFDTYLRSGFNNKNIANVDKVYGANISNHTLKDAITYLKSVTERHQNNWTAYEELDQKIISLRNWQYCGVFENLNESGLDKFYEPEAKAFSEKPFDAKSNGLVNWYKANTESTTYQFFRNHEEYGSGVHYAQTFISIPESKRVVLRMGNGSAFKVWLNDVLLTENDKELLSELNAFQVEITIPKGNNRLLIKNAESGYGSYFIVSVLNTDKEPIFVESSANYSPYNKSTKDEINPIILKNEFEEYFLSKVSSNPNDFIYKYCLVKTYLRNSKYDKAKEILLPLLKEHPKSSLLRKLIIPAYEIEEDYTSIREIKENMENDDPDYYMPLVLKITDSKELSRMSLNELENFLEKFKSSTDLRLFDHLAEFYLDARKGDKEAVKKDLDNLIEASSGYVKLQSRYAPFYASLFEDDDKTIKILEQLDSKYFYPEVSESLSYYYDKQGKKDKALHAISQHKDKVLENSYLRGIIKTLHGYERYEESLELIDQALLNFPYSFVMMELKGDALLQLNRKKEAISFYEESLKYNSADSGLRKKIKDLKNEKNLLEDLIPKDVYDYINDNKNKITSNNYGFNILLDDGSVELYTEGGGKYRYIYAYEITSESGVERFKEYDLGLSGSYTIIKSEIVKSDKSIVPADRSGSSLVFNGLSIGDVVYIDYESSFSSTGRFYKDFTDYFQFSSFHPIVNSSYKILVPNILNLKYKVVNDQVDFKKESLKEYTLYKWSVQNKPAIPQDEYYMPPFSDVAGVVHLSTINSWNDIATWYSDLVRSRLEINSTVKEVFHDLFPNGYTQLSKEERAKKIYSYITDKLTYSYVSFKQSGFVPQKPSKTINTALGDCKDFSTLFVTLGQMAELDTNLVLILTSDYGEDAMIMPNQDFNHCIAKVNLDGKEQYIELTDKYLPFGSLPTSLYNATALEIPYKNDIDQTYNLFKLHDDTNRDFGVFKNDVEINLYEDKSKLVVRTELEGHVKSFYSNLVSEPNYEVKKKSIFEDFKGRLEGDFTLDELKDIIISDDKKVSGFTSVITMNNKIDKIGSINIYKLPTIAKSYTNGIIETQERNYPIFYTDYENVDKYIINYTITIPEGKKFIEIPESKTLTFKNHSYTIDYKLQSDNVLKVNIVSDPDLNLIDPKDYPEFRNYVKSILEAEDELIGFK